MRGITKKELALLYFPDSPPDTAVRRLIRWFNQCHDLSSALALAGYKASHKTLTPRQLKIIYYYLGEP